MLATPLARPLPLEIELAGDPSVQLNCDINVLAQGLAELIDNALEAKSERAGVRVNAGRSVAFCVWDDGPGFEAGVQRALHWGVSTRAGALGLGLTLALRSARAHGFSLEFSREQERTLATLLVPARDVLGERDKLAP
jgi:signal transduction histidine kinase